MTMRVRVTTGSGPPSEFALDGDEVLIGRAATSRIVLNDAKVSRQHARLVRRDDAWWVEDLGARNRTRLNGAPVQQAERLHAGDRLEVGDALLRVIDEGPATEATSAGPADAARMWTINEIHRALSGPLSLAELLDVMLARCFDVLDPEEGLILLRSADGALAPMASRRRGPNNAPVTVPRRLVDEVAGKAQPALVLDAAYDDRFSGSASMVASGIRSIVAAPIVDAEGTLGLITLCSRLAVRRFTQADLDMLVTIAAAAALRVRNTALADALAERRVVEHELELAHDVQMSMLPRSMPERAGLSIAGALKPARSVGGDLYDAVLDGDRLWFIVADVAGKSIAAALYMAVTRALFRATAGGAHRVEDVAARVNAELARDNDQLMFVTAALGCLDFGSGVLSLVDAGHTPALIAEGARVNEVAGLPKGPAFGVVPGFAYEAAHVPLTPESTLVLFTDGVTDALDAKGNEFGPRRLYEALGGVTGRQAGDVVAAVIGAVDAFVANAPPEDDLTVLALRYSPA